MTWLAAAALMALPGAAWAAGFDDPESDDASQQLDGGVPVGPYSNVQRQDTPNDPDYDRAEPDDETPAATPSTNMFDERFDLFGFASARTRETARYLDAANPRLGSGQVSGFNAAGAWKITRGDPSVGVAVLDTGINWDSAGVRDKVALNVDELPPPEPANPAAGLNGYDLNDNAAVDVDDYANDPAVTAVAGADPPTGQDLIRAFEDDTDDDQNGYVDDIAGWDFFDDDNDPQDTSSYFAAENHGSGRAAEAVEKGNDSAGELGVCPQCQFVPMRVWDTFVSDQNNFFMAVVYATDNGAEVILGADGGLYHSAFSERASEYAYDHGVAQVYSGDDLNTGNHNYPAAYDHTMLIEGVVADAEGLGMDLPDEENDPGFRDILVDILNGLGAGTMAPLQTYFRGANTTQFGGKSSISMQGPTGSTNTGKAAGAAALVISAARQRTPSVDLSADETRELLEQTAEDILPGDTTGTGTPDPAQSGFETHFGYGRANVGEAVREASAGRIPPEASIGSPDWYAPLTGDTALITGLADARESVGDGDFTWKLEYGLGLAPKESEWTEVRDGASEGPEVTDFGPLPLDQIREELATREASPTGHPDRDDPAGPTLDATDPKLDPYRGQFTVRLTVTSEDGGVLPGVDRKVLTAVEDPTLRPGFPKRLGTGGEAPLRYADLDGDNLQELVLPTEDGFVHAFRADGSELPGWPVRTQTQFSATRHLASPALQEIEPPLEPPRAPTIADLTGDGRPEVITAAGERMYAWTSAGEPLNGWPVRPDPGRANCALSEQQKELKHPKCGFLATPAVARLEGRDKPLDVVVPGLDGRLRAYRPDGTPVPGFPVRLIDSEVPAGERMTAESINSPAIGDLDRDGRDDIVVPTNEVYGGSGGGGGDVSFGGLLAGAGTTSRVYAVKSTGTVSQADADDSDAFFDGWPIKPGGIIQDVLPLIGPGHDPALVELGGEQQVLVSVTGGRLALYGADGTLTREIEQNGGVSEGALNLFESAAVGDLDGAAGPDIVKYQVDLGQAANLLLVGQNAPYSHRIGAFSAATGTKLPAWPIVTDDYQFLSTSTVARLTPGTSNQVVAGTGLGLLHAYDGLTGLDVSGFPKVTGGWLFAPAALSDDGRMAGITREGFLFEWDAPQAPACQTEWPSFRHDQQGTGNYDADGTPPAAPGAMSLQPRGGNTYRLSFRSPGDDGFCGTAQRYVADVDGRAVDLGQPAAGGSTFTRDIDLGPGARRVTVRAEDEAPNLGPPGAVERGGASGSPGYPLPGNGSGKPCLPRRARVTAGRIGPARLGAPLRSLQRRYRVARRSRGTVRFCVRGGGRFLVRARRGRVDFVATTARRHRTRQVAPGSRARRGRLRGARRVRRGLLVGTLRRRGRVVYGTRAGRVRFLAVVSRRQAAQPRSLARRLRALGLR